MAPYLPHDPRNPVPLALQGHLGGPLPEYQIRREDRGLQPIVEESVNDNGQEIIVNDAQPEDDTGSHGWAAVSLVWLHKQLLGVRLLEPGGENLRIQPDCAGLPYVAGHTMSPKGPLWVYWEPAEYEMEITLPPSMATEVVVPIGFGHTRWSVLFCPKSATVDSVDGAWRISGAGTYQFGLR